MLYNRTQDTSSIQGTKIIEFLRHRKRSAATSLRRVINRFAFAPIDQAFRQWLNFLHDSIKRQKELIKLARFAVRFRYKEAGRCLISWIAFVERRRNAFSLIVRVLSRLVKLSIGGAFNSWQQISTLHLKKQRRIVTLTRSMIKMKRRCSFRALDAWLNFVSLQKEARKSLKFILIHAAKTLMRRHLTSWRIFTAVHAIKAKIQPFSKS